MFGKTAFLPADSNARQTDRLSVYTVFRFSKTEVVKQKNTFYIQLRFGAEVELVLLLFFITPKGSTTITNIAYNQQTRKKKKKEK